MSGEYLISCASVQRGGNIRATYESDQCNSDCTELLEDTLRCTIWACGYNPVVGPSDIEDTSEGQQDVVYKEGEL